MVSNIGKACRKECIRKQKRHDAWKIITRVDRQSRNIHIIKIQIINQEIGPKKKYQRCCCPFHFFLYFLFSPSNLMRLEWPDSIHIVCVSSSSRIELVILGIRLTMLFSLLNADFLLQTDRIQSQYTQFISRWLVGYCQWVSVCLYCKTYKQWMCGYTHTALSLSLFFLLARCYVERSRCTYTHWHDELWAYRWLFVFCGCHRTPVKFK